MDLVNILKNKKINTNDITEYGVFLRKQWEDNFASAICVQVQCLMGVKKKHLRWRC